MERDYIISVAMATYNGEKYIKEQLDSILKQLNNNDEIVISDDGSTDNTLKIIESYHDKRIKVLKGPCLGFKKNFENALKYCKGKYIFISDQDDIWLDNKIQSILDNFEKYNVSCIVHDAIIKSNNKIKYSSFFEWRKVNSGLLHNFIKSGFYGCCMAIDKNILKKALPIPENIESHDYWIGMISELNGNVIFLKEKLMIYRRHENNVSSIHHASLVNMIKKRIILAWNLIRFYFRNRRMK